MLLPFTLCASVLFIPVQRDNTTWHTLVPHPACGPFVCPGSLPSSSRRWRWLLGVCGGRTPVQDLWSAPPAPCCPSATPVPGWQSGQLFKAAVWPACILVAFMLLWCFLVYGSGFFFLYRLTVSASLPSLWTLKLFFTCELCCDWILNSPTLTPCLHLLSSLLKVQIVLFFFPSSPSSQSVIGA